MVKRAAKATEIEMRDGLPRYTEDDVNFVCQQLEPIEPQSIAGFVRLVLKLAPRSTATDSPAAAARRIAVAFRKGLETGRLTKSEGRKTWRVAVKVARAS